MSKSLVIVESPNKVPTIKKYLGADFKVASSVGHIRDLPNNSEFAKGATRTRKTDPLVKYNYQALKMGINPNTWEGDFQIVPLKESTVKDLKKAAKGCDLIYLATDLDREGEAIAWHLEQVLGKGHTYKRVIFNEITETAIKKAFQHPISIDMDRVHAQQTRRYLDRLVGFLVSPILWKKVGKGLSAGRVQSVAMRMIVEREREIRTFVPTNFWKLSGTYKKLNFELIAINGKKLTSPEDEKAFYIDNEDKALELFEIIKNNKAIIKKINIKDTSVKPKPPFTTSSLQQSVSTRLGFSIRSTMQYAQSLYESGKISYIRTDSTNLSEDAVNLAKSFILKEWGEGYLSKEQRSYSSANESAQEAHEAIRPSTLKVSASSFAREQERKLFNLIKARFLASQMENAIYQNTSLECEIEIKGTVLTFRCSERLLKFPGFYAAEGVKADDIVDLTGGLKEGAELSLLPLVSENATKPPPRYNEASLVKELEKRSIGRPSTYVSIISTIEDRGYVTKDENQRFHGTKIAEIVNDRLLISFKEIMDYDFTAQMEANLDAIAQGNKKWTKELDKFWHSFVNQLITAEQNESEGGMPTKDLIPTDLICPKCKKHKMALQHSKSGNFLTCLGYEIKDASQCKNTVSLITEKTFLGDKYQAQEKERCPKCNSPIEPFYLDMNTKFKVCTNIPTCDYTSIEKGQFSEEEATSIPCNECGHTMDLTLGRYGKYYKCSHCDSKAKIDKDGNIVYNTKKIEFPELECKVGTFVLRQSAAGAFLGSSAFPRSRETMNLTVDIIKQFYDRFPEDLQFLASGPTEDPVGNPTVIRYSKKLATQYIGSKDSNGKFSTYQAFYEDGKWVDNAEEYLKAIARKSKKESSSKTTKKSTVKASKAKNKNTK